MYQVRKYIKNERKDPAACLSYDGTSKVPDGEVFDSVVTCGLSHPPRQNSITPILTGDPTFKDVGMTQSLYILFSNILFTRNYFPK